MPQHHPPLSPQQAGQHLYQKQQQMRVEVVQGFLRADQRSVLGLGLSRHLGTLSDQGFMQMRK